MRTVDRWRDNHFGKPECRHDRQVASFLIRSDVLHCSTRGGRPARGPARSGSGRDGCPSPRRWSTRRNGHCPAVGVKAIRDGAGDRPFHRGHSSVGRAQALQAWGHRFEPGCLHHASLGGPISAASFAWQASGPSPCKGLPFEALRSSAKKGV